MAEPVLGKERIPALMEKYKLTGDYNVRNEIVLLCMDTVKIVVNSMRNIYSAFAETDDVVNEGVIALITAVDSFDEKKGVKFETYASIRIRGAVIDYIRRQDRVPRQLRRMSKQLDEQYMRLQGELGRVPADEELAKALNITTEQLSKLMSSSAGMITLSFEELLYEDNLDEQYSGHSDTADAKLYEKEKKQVIADAIKQLNEKERQIVTMYYFERLKYDDIARVLDISRSRVCQIHSKAMLLLKSKLESYIKG